MITYKGFIGTFLFDETNNIFYGSVSNSHYPITFQGKSLKSAQEAFEDSVNEYITWCKKHGKNHNPIQIDGWQNKSDS